MSGQIPEPAGVRVGFGGGFGRGRGFRNVCRATGHPFRARTSAGAVPMQSPEITKEQEIRMLENQANIMEQELKEIKARLEELKKIE
jgi:hypothetical protein